MLRGCPCRPGPENLGPGPALRFAAMGSAEAQTPDKVRTIVAATARIRPPAP